MRILDLCLALVSFLPFCLQQPIDMSALMCANANSSHRSLSFFFFSTDYVDSPDCLPILLSISVFYCLVFSVFHFLVVGSVR